MEVQSFQPFNRFGPFKPFRSFNIRDPLRDPEGVAVFRLTRSFRFPYFTLN